MAARLLVCVPLDKDALYKLKSEPVLIQFVLRELNFVALEYSLRKMMFKSLKKCFVYITDCALTPSLSRISLRISLSARSNVYVRGRCCPLPVFSPPNVEKTCLQGWISSSICRCHCQTSLMKSSSRNTTSVSCCSTHSLFSHTPFPPYAAHSRSQVSPLLCPVWFMRSLLSTGQGLIFTSRMFARLSFIDGEVTPRWRLFSGWVVFRDQILITNEHVNIFFTFDYLLFDEWIHGKGQLLRIMFPCLMMWKHSFIESCSATQQQLITHFRPQIWVSELQLQLSFMGWVFSHVALEEKFRLILRETWMCVQHFMEIHIQHTHIQ